MGEESFTFLRYRLAELRNGESEEERRMLDLIEQKWLCFHKDPEGENDDVWTEGQPMAMGSGTVSEVRSWVAQHGNSPRLIELLSECATAKRPERTELLPPMPEGLKEQLAKLSDEFHRAYAMVGLNANPRHQLVLDTLQQYPPGREVWMVATGTSIVACSYCDGKGYGDPETRRFRCERCHGQGNCTIQVAIASTKVIDHLEVREDSVAIRIWAPSSGGLANCMQAHPYSDDPKSHRWQCQTRHNTFFMTESYCSAYIARGCK